LELASGVRKKPRKTQTVRDFPFLTKADVKCRYSGEFEAGKPHGKGKLVYPISHERKSYSGYFINGLFDGHGKLKFSNGDWFVGSWKADRMKGVGTLERKGEFHYTGNFDYDFHYGLGTMTDHSGAIHEGEWFLGQK
jgi:hypothetical protein